MTEVMQIDGPGRRDSVGTLTGWQLLAQAVQPGDVDTLSSSAAPSNQDQQPAGHRAATGKAKHMRSLSSLSHTSSMSDDSCLGPAAASVTPRPHQWLYKEYKIQDEIGSGGFGRVCRARRLTDGKVVVVKEIKTTNLSAKQKAATMDEVQVLANFNHPNIVKYHDCFMDDVYINIVMEYCNAGDLAGLVKRKAGQLMPEHEIMSLFVQICLALHYVHAAGVLHRDLKTSNVLMTSSASFGGMPLLKLGDFGVAKINSAESSMASTIVGTPQYLSPEMCDNKPYGKKSDVWALGCILYELCTLHKAFDVGNGGISGIILKIMRGAYAPIPASYSDEMKQLVSSMLKTDPAQRPSVHDILGMPFVKQHLGSYLDWARHVPEAHPEILLASLGEGYKGHRGSRTGHPAGLARPSPMGGWSSAGSDASQALQRQLSGAGSSPRVPVQQRGSGSMAVEHAAAAAAVAGLSVRSKNGSRSDCSNGSLSGAEGSPHHAANRNAAAGVGTAASPATPLQQQPGQVTGSSGDRQQVQVSFIQQLGSGGSSGPAALPPKTAAGFESSSSIQRKQSSASSSREQHITSTTFSDNLPQQPLQHPALGSGGSNNSTLSSLPSQPGWTHPAPPDALSSKPGLAAEQIEGLRRLRGLKARLQVTNYWDAAASSTRLGTALQGLASLDLDTVHSSHCSAML